ncbi:hypothetical protein CYMTET_35427, partial [Cymbomonas tetramitiformis]
LPRPLRSTSHESSESEGQQSCDIDQERVSSKQNVFVGPQIGNLIARDEVTAWENTLTGPPPQAVLAWLRDVAISEGLLPMVQDDQIAEAIISSPETTIETLFKFAFNSGIDAALRWQLVEAKALLRAAVWLQPQQREYILFAFHPEIRSHSTALRTWERGVHAAPEDPAQLLGLSRELIAVGNLTGAKQVLWEAMRRTHSGEGEPEDEGVEACLRAPLSEQQQHCLQARLLLHGLGASLSHSELAWLTIEMKAGKLSSLSWQLQSTISLLLARARADGGDHTGAFEEMVAAQVRSMEGGALDGVRSMESALNGGGACSMEGMNMREKRQEAYHTEEAEDRAKQTVSLFNNKWLRGHRLPTPAPALVMTIVVVG